MNARRQGSDVCWFFLTRDDGRLEWVLIGPQQRQRGWLAKPDGRAFSGAELPLRDRARLEDGRVLRRRPGGRARGS
jgi:hypothetical protein